MVFHREGNWPSNQLNERFGGRYSQTRLQWAASLLRGRENG